MKNLSSGIVIALAIIISAAVLAGAYKFRYKQDDIISVTGSAEVDFESDLIVWKGNYSRFDFDLKSAFSALKQDENRIREYIVSKGIAAGDIVFSSVDLFKDFNRNYDNHGNMISSSFNGYRLSQTVTVESKDIDKVATISREITELIQTGIEVSSNNPSYFYTKLSELKLDLLSKAGEDAKDRAERIAKNAGGKIDKLKKANMGVFQITGKNANEDYSYGGAFNTSSRLKTASITLRAEYNVK